MIFKLDYLKSKLCLEYSYKNKVKYCETQCWNSADAITIKRLLFFRLSGCQACALDIDAISVNGKYLIKD